MVLAIVAMFCAAALVLFLQHRATAALEAQTQVILRQISEQAAVDVAQDLRRSLNGPVFETLTAVNHPDLLAGRLDLVAEEFAAGLSSYPHVDRFFAWHAQTETVAPGEVVFYGRGQPFTRDPELGRAIRSLAHQYAATQQIYVAGDHIGPGAGHQVFLRLFWVDAERRDYFAILGFVVDPVQLGARLFDASARSRIQTLLSRRGGGEMPLQLRVTDEAGAVVFGPTDAPAVHASLQFPMLFYPAETIQSRLAAGIEPRPWALDVIGPAVPMLNVAPNPGYWPTLASIALMLLALAFTMRAYRRSEELATMQRDFVAHVSHQLKTPLSALSAATETLQMDRVQSPQQLSQYLGIIQGETTRLSSLVQRVLEFSRVQQSRQYEFEPVDLGALVRETVDAFAQGLPAPARLFQIETPEAGPFVHADPAAIEQVIVNLLDNAVKYSNDALEITVRARTDRGRATIEVQDRGIGIAQHDQPRIFERFYRGADASQRRGFGLGLPIVRELVRAHSGSVDVSSAPGVGSTFRVSLPRLSNRAAAATADPLSGPTPVASETPREVTS
jgi:signal transduction histidine kinase